MPQFDRQREASQQDYKWSSPPRNTPTPSAGAPLGRGDARRRRVRGLDVHRLDLTVTVEKGEELTEPRTASYFVYRPGWYEEEAGRGGLVTEKEEDWERQQQLRGF